MIRHADNNATYPLRVETAAMESGGNRRRVLFDESIARRTGQPADVPRAGLFRSPLEWATAAVQFITNASKRRPVNNSGDIEVRG